MRTTEFEISVATLKVANSKTNNIARFDDLRKEIPFHINLTQGDLEESLTRPGEKLWEQIIRNIRSHYKSENNFIFLGYLEHIKGTGYKITESGKKYLNSLNNLS